MGSFPSVQPDQSPLSTVPFITASAMEANQVSIVILVVTLGVNALPVLELTPLEPFTH